MNVRNTLQTVLKILLVSFISIGKLEIIWGGCFRRWSWWWVVEFLRGGPRAGVCGVVSRRRRRRRRRRRGRRGTRPVLGARLGPPPALYRPFSADPTLVEGGCWRSSTESSDVSQWAEVRMPLFVTERERGVKFRDFFVWTINPIQFSLASKGCFGWHWCHISWLRTTGTPLSRTQLAPKKLCPCYGFYSSLPA